MSSSSSSSSSSSRRSSGPVLPFAKAFQRSISPSGRLSSSSQYMDRRSYSSAPSYHRSTSPTRVNLHGFGPLSPSVRFSIDRSRSPGRSMSASSPRGDHHTYPKKTCMCSPTSHPGSFRCSLHKNNAHNERVSHQSAYLPNRLNARRSAMANSLVRIGTVEGDLVKRALAQLIRPSSHQQRRRGAFQPRPSRLSIMSKAGDDDDIHKHSSFTDSDIIISLR